MARKPQTKKIKVISKGIVTTSRGRCRTPIAIPYMENTETILSMLTRDKAKIVEILPTGKEVELTIFNFSQDNSKVEEQTAIKAAHVADPAVVNAGQPKTPSDRPLTRKERRELERKARAEAELAAKEVTEDMEKETALEGKVEQEAPVETAEKAEPATIEESSAIAVDAIDE